jgi:hypothetical protein
MVLEGEISCGLTNERSRQLRERKTILEKRGDAAMIRMSLFRANARYRDRPAERAARWARGFVIDDSLKGSTNPLHGRGCFGDVLGGADLLELLRDIEAKL